MKKHFALASMVCVASLMPLMAQRQISSFKEMKATYGHPVTIGGKEYSDPDIYYLPQEDGTYQAVRLTIPPLERSADITVPYLNMATPTSICVNWKTSADATGSTVKYGLSPERLDNICDASGRGITSTYFWNTANLTGLIPDTPYYYQVLSNGTESAIYRFRTPRVAGDKSKLRVLVIGDHQRNERSDYEWLLSAARQKVKEKYGDGPFEDNIAFLLNDGDQVDGGYIDLYEKVHLFKSRSVSPTLPNMTVVGNHEYKNDPTLNLYDGHYHEYGLLDYQGIKSGNAGYYAYQNGAVLFIALNSDDPSPEQKFWLRKVIAAASTDNTVQFVVSVQHRPLYAEQWSGDVSAWMLNEIMPILSSTPKHVLNIGGHHHLYARGQMTDTPVYHIITGGGVGTSAEGYEQLWGKTPDNYNHQEVQKTIDHWTYQILEFDPETATMTVDCYSIGNSRLALDNELVDSFSRTLGDVTPPSVPGIAAIDSSVTLPAKFTISTSLDPIHSVQFQVAADPSFDRPVLDKIVTFEDFYGANEDYTPLDINRGIDLKEITLPEGSLFNGTYYIRVRNRSVNLDWSAYSDPVQFTVEGVGEQPSVSMTDNFFHPGASIHIDYTGAPLNTEAWIGIYKENHNPGEGNASVKYIYTDGVSNSWDFTVDAPGAYYAVMFKDGGYSECTPRSYFVVSDNCDRDHLPSLSTDKLVYDVGEPVVVRLHNAPCIQNDWIGLYDSSVAVVKDGKSHSYAYVGTDPEGEVALNVQGNYNYTSPVGDGVYYVTYCIDNEYYEPVRRSYLIVGKPVVLAAGKESYSGGEVVAVTFEGAPGWEEDRLKIYHGTELAGEYPLGAAGGSVAVGQLPAGSYEACVTTVGGNEISPRISFTVLTSADASDWMASLPDHAYVHQVSIPGTHDAATGNGTSADSFARTQDLTLVGQFAAGIRAFDLRPSVENNALQLYHGIISTNISFEDALDDLCQLLDRNPTEFVIVVMRHEDDHESKENKALWSGLMASTLASPKYAGRLVDFKNSLTVGEMRGKILILSRDRYAEEPVGGYISGWTHSASLSDQKKASIAGASDSGKATLFVQDFYETNGAMDTKINALKALLDASAKLKSARSHTWVINHSSGYSKVSLFVTDDAYRLNAESTNQAVIDYLADNPKPGPTGMVMMDFAGVDESGKYTVNGAKLIKAVIDNNARYEMRGEQSGLEAVTDTESSLRVVGNGKVVAEGPIEAYTVSGQLVTVARGYLELSAPGIYILHASGATSRLLVK